MSPIYLWLSSVPSKVNIQQICIKGNQITQCVCPGVVASCLYSRVLAERSMLPSAGKILQYS